METIELLIATHTAQIDEFRRELERVRGRLKALEADKQADNWEETARSLSKDRDYYKELVVSIGKIFDKDALTADDGIVHEELLCAKIPTLVAKNYLDCIALKAQVQVERNRFDRLCLRLENALQTHFSYVHRTPNEWRARLDAEMSREGCTHG